MENISLLFMALIMSIVVYAGYRQFFLKIPKKKAPKKPHFTLKIESE